MNFQVGLFNFYLSLISTYLNFYLPILNFYLSLSASLRSLSLSLSLSVRFSTLKIFSTKKIVRIEKKLFAIVKNVLYYSFEAVKQKQNERHKMKTTNLHETTGNDKLRPQLEYIYLQDMKNVVATDGITLFYSTFQDVFGINPVILENTELIENLVNSGIYIHKTEFKKIANKELSDVVTYDKERQEIRFTDIKGNNVFLIKYETKISGTYPYWERVLVEKKDASTVEKIAFNPEILERINKVCKPMNANIVRFYLYETNKAVLFECSNLDARKISGMIMPMRFEHQ